MTSTEINSGEATVEDEENVVDQKTKEQILNLRSAIDDDERRLYVDRLRNPELNYTRNDANSDWGVSVRQYLRGIKRLWNEQEDVGIKRVDYYWKEKQIAREVFYPPDKDGYRFSLAQYQEEYDDKELRDAIGLGRGVDIPEPKRVEFNGLSSVLERKHIELTWIIKTDAEGPPPRHNTERVSVNVPLPKYILENAVEAADEFLQQAGVGFAIGVPDYMGGDEPGI